MSRLDESRRIAEGLPETPPEVAAETVADDATLVVSGFGSVGYPKAVPLALAEADRDLSLTVISGGSVGGEIDTRLIEADAISRRYPYQATSAARESINSGRIAFHDRHIAGIADEMITGQFASPDTAIVEAVAVGEDWLIPTTSIGHTPVYIEQADDLIVEVNRAQPRELAQLHDVYRPSPPNRRDPIPIREPSDRIGSQKVTFNPDKLTAVVRTEQRDSPYSFRTPTADDRRIASHLREFLTDELASNPVFEESVCLQFGVGSLGNALMNEIAEVPTGDRSVSYYGEVIQDGLLDLLVDGTLEVASATSLALSEAGQTRLFENIDDFVDDVVLRPADVSNAPEIINRFGMFSVNSALEVDIYGHVNSTHARGRHLVNGIGGSNDFIRNSIVSVIALPSAADGESLSRICPMVPHVDHTEHDVSVIITEQGVADLRGLSPRERAQEIIDKCSHPRYRDALRGYYDRSVEGGGHVPHDLAEAFEWDS